MGEACADRKDGKDHMHTLLIFFKKPRKELMLMPPTKASVRYCMQGKLCELHRTLDMMNYKV